MIEWFWAGFVFIFKLGMVLVGIVAFCIGAACACAIAYYFGVFACKVWRSAVKRYKSIMDI